MLSGNWKCFTSYIILLSFIQNCFASRLNATQLVITWISDTSSWWTERIPFLSHKYNFLNICGCCLKNFVAIARKRADDIRLDSNSRHTAPPINVFDTDIDIWHWHDVKSRSFWANKDGWIIVIAKTDRVVQACSLEWWQWLIRTLPECYRRKRFLFRHHTTVLREQTARPVTATTLDSVCCLLLKHVTQKVRMCRVVMHSNNY